MDLLLMAKAQKDKEMAEKMFKDQNFQSAKFYAQNAQWLCYKLDGINELVEALDVILAAKKKTKKEEVDRYKVLGVNPNADYDIIRKKYKKLAYAVHPDRNKSVAALTAFMIISEAWNLLSNKESRALYDLRRKNKEIFKMAILKKPSVFGGNQAKFFPSASNRNSSNQGAYESANPFQSPQAPSFPTRPSFWTVCNRCKVEFEYDRKYLNKNLRCLHCNGHFLAAEILMASLLTSGNAALYASQQQNYVHQHSNFGPQVSRWQPTPTANVGWAGCYRPNLTSNMYNNEGFFTNVGATIGLDAFTPSQPWVGTIQAEVGAVTDRREWKRKLGSKGSYSNAWGSSSAGIVPNDVPQKRRNGLEALNSDARGFSSAGMIPQEDMPRKRKAQEADHVVTDSETESDSPTPLTNLKKVARIGDGNMASSAVVVAELAKRLAEQKKAFMGGDVNVGFCMTFIPEPPMPANDEKKASLQGVENLVFSVGNVCKSLKKENGRKKAAQSQTKKVTFAEATSRFKHRGWRNFGRASYCKLSKELVPKENKHLASKTKEMISMRLRAQVESNASEEGAQPIMMSVPDPDFYDFDKHRTNSALDFNQVWAAYDHEDGMPRFYAQIHYVISEEPFYMKISWLTPNPNNDALPADWITSGFAKTSGKFQPERPEDYGDLISFSHKVVWKRDTKANILVYPFRGEVWALYKNWSPNSNASTPNEVVREYYFVEVVGSFKKRRGVRALPLIKVPGFKSVFRRAHGRSLIKTIPKEEMNRFSHRVPAHRLTGEEAPNAPKGFWDVDPTACPKELLQVIPVEEPSKEETEHKVVEPQEQPVVERSETMTENVKKVNGLKIYFRRR